MHKLLAVFALLSLVFLYGCESTPIPAGPDADGSKSCVDCHTNQALLKQLAVNDDLPEGDAGEG